MSHWVIYAITYMHCIFPLHVYSTVLELTFPRYSWKFSCVCIACVLHAFQCTQEQAKHKEHVYPLSGYMMLQCSILANCMYAGKMCAAHVSILYPDNGCPCVCPSRKWCTSHLWSYWCMYCERYSDVTTLPRYCFHVQWILMSSYLAGFVHWVLVRVVGTACGVCRWRSHPWLARLSSYMYARKCTTWNGVVSLISC